MRVIFVHGLLLRGYEAVCLARHLRGEGVKWERFRYASRRELPAKVATRLAEDLRQAPDTHAIAHSLGGLIALAALAEAQPHWQGRAMLLGSPLTGGTCARRTAEMWGASGCLVRRVIGCATDSLRWFCRWTANQGVGRVLRACSPPRDGVVRVAGTRLEGAVYLPQVKTTHLGLIFNRHVADAAVHFIRNQEPV